MLDMGTEETAVLARRAAVVVVSEMGKLVRGSGVRGARGPGVGFGGPPAGVDLVKGARRIRARAGRSPFYALFPAPRAAAAANPAGPRRGRRPQIASQPRPTDSLSAPQPFISNRTGRTFALSR